MSALERYISGEQYNSNSSESEPNNTAQCEEQSESVNLDDCNNSPTSIQYSQVHYNAQIDHSENEEVQIRRNESYSNTVEADIADNNPFLHQSWRQSSTHVSNTTSDSRFGSQSLDSGQELQPDTSVDLLHSLSHTIKVRIVSGRYVVGNNSLPSVLLVTFPRARFTYGKLSTPTHDLANYRIEGVIRHIRVSSSENNLF